MNKYKERIYNGVVKENPSLVLMLGMCPTLAVTTSAVNGIGMGLSTLAVLIFSNLIISLMRKIIPDQVRLPAYIVIVASLVTVVDLLLQAYAPGLYSALGIYIPLIVVNCIILGRAEAYANKVGPGLALFDSLGMGLGFTVGLTSIGIVRELIGAGTLFNYQILPDSYQPITIFILAPGAFFVLACLTALQNVMKKKAIAKGDPNAAKIGCGAGCESCGKRLECGGSTTIETDKKEEEQK